MWVSSPSLAELTGRDEGEGRMLCFHCLSAMAVRISTGRLTPEDTLISHEEGIGLDVQGRKDQGPGDNVRMTSGTLFSVGFSRRFIMTWLQQRQMGTPHIHGWWR